MLIKLLNAFRCLSKCWRTKTRTFFFPKNMRKNLIILQPSDHGHSSSKRVRSLTEWPGSVYFYSQDRSVVCGMTVLSLSFYIRCKKGTQHATVLVSPYSSPFLFTFSTNLSLVLDFDARLMDILPYISFI